MLEKYIERVVESCLASFQSVNECEEQEFIEVEIDSALPSDYEGIAQIVAADPKVLSLKPDPSDGDFPDVAGQSVSFLRHCFFDYIYSEVKTRLKGKLDISML